MSRETRLKCLGLICGSSLALSASFAYAQTPATSASTQDNSAISEIVVTGSRLSATGFTAPTPVTVVSAQDLLQDGPATALEALNQMPSFRPTQQTADNGRNTSAQSGIQGLIDLRGLGVPRTLTLVDGERFVGGGYFGQPDTNMFPSGLINRVEVTTGGASAAYGSDAVAGVVNFVLNDRLQGMNASVQGGQSEYADDRELIASIAGGTGFADGNGHVVFDYDNADNGGIPNMYSRPFGRVEPGLVGTGTVGSATRPAGTPANIWTNGVEYATETDGGIITSGPLKGTAFDANGNPYAFPYGTVYGSSMVGSAANYGNNPQGYFTIGNKFNRNVFYTKATYDFSPEISAFVTGSFGYVTESSIASPPPATPAAIIINSTNPYIPAATLTAMNNAHVSSITVGKVFDIGGTKINEQNRTWRVAGGLRGKAFNSWDWDAYYTHGQTTEWYSFLGLITADAYAAADVVNGANGPTCAPTASNPNLTATLAPQVQPGCVPFDIFGYSVPSAVYNYIFRPIKATIYVVQDAGAANLRGSPVSDWAGAVPIAVGVEARHDSVQSVVNDPLSLENAYATADQANYGGSNSVAEGYVEAGVPLASNLGHFVKALDLNLAARETDYEHGGAVTTWKLGATYDINDAWRLRVTRSQDIRAPNLYELFGNNPTSVMPNIINPANGQVGTVYATSLGNPKLVPETAQTLTYGVVFNPREGWARGFRASIDYFDISISNLIATVGVQDTINGCVAGNASYCSRITYNSTPFGIATVFSEPSNLDYLRTSGVDFDFEYQLGQLPFGIPGGFDASLVATNTEHWRLTTPAGTLEYAGSPLAAAGGGGSPRWRGQLNLSYVLHDLSTQFRIRAFSQLIYSPSLIGPGQAGYNPALSNSISQNLWPGFTYLDWTETYSFTRPNGLNWQVFGVVTNVFNREPPAYALNAFSLNYANYYDDIGRTYQLGFRLRL